MNPDSLSFMDKPLPEKTEEQRLYEVHHRLFRRNLAEAMRDIERASSNAVRYIQAADKSGYFFEDAEELIKRLDETCHAATLNVLLAKSAYAKRFAETPVSEAAE